MDKFNVKYMGKFLTSNILYTVAILQKQEEQIRTNIPEHMHETPRPNQEKSKKLFSF